MMILALRSNMKNLKICLGILCLLPVLAVGTSQFIEAISFMKLIQLDEGRKGLFAQVDDEDYQVLVKYKWRSFINGGKPYARTFIYYDNYKKSVPLQMHRVLLGLTNPKEVCDHIDRDTLNNQRNNLRPCTIKQNSWNIIKSKKNATSKYLGVHLASNNKWHASISIDDRTTSLGSFETEDLAALAYNEKAKELRGEFANLNKI